MRYGIFDIIAAHYRTFSGSTFCYVWDVIALFLIPIFVGIGASQHPSHDEVPLFNSAIAAYSIFAALLLSSQVGVYGIFQSDTRKISDLEAGSTEQKNLLKKRDLLEELNSNISYCVILSVFSVGYLLATIFVRLNPKWEIGVFWFISTHFFFSLLIVIRKTHALFQGEYLNSK